MKTAVCLVVKNEEKDIPYWLSWYKSIGFDTVIIYDDFSDDKTYESIKSTSGFIDTIYYRNVVNRDRSATRQLRAYNDTISRYKNTYDWIAFFDSDEYLDLYGENIKDYLKNFENFDCIAFNWCCFGNNNHVNRPEGSPIFSYTKHGKKSLNWNRHTKVMVRPKSVNGRMYYAHNCPVSGKTADASGNPIEWSSEHGGITKNDATWEGARLLHFHSRSLENYINKYKNLEDFRKSKKDPIQEIISNDEYCAVDFEISKKTKEIYIKSLYDLSLFQKKYIASKIFCTPDSGFLFLQNHFSEENIQTFNPIREISNYDISQGWISFHEKPGNALKNNFPDGENIVFFKMKNFFGKNLSIVDHKLVCDEEKSNLIGVYKKGSNYVCLFDENFDFFYINGDPRIDKMLVYKVWQNENGSISLSHPRTGRYLGFKPNGDYVVNKIRALNWEHINIEVVHDIKNNFLKSIIEKCSDLDIFSTKSMSCFDFDFVSNSIGFIVSIYDELSLNSVSFLVGGTMPENIF